MAFQVSRTGYNQIDPTFLPGRLNIKQQYHNVGQLMTPYQGKRFGVSGDYGPPQQTVYYNDRNRTYPYVMDSNFRAEQYLPGAGCMFGHPGYSAAYEPQYPEQFVAPNYFSPQTRYPTGHAKPTSFSKTDYSAYLPETNIREGYTYNGVSSGISSNEKLRVAYKGMRGGKNFYRPRHLYPQTQKNCNKCSSCL